MLRAATIYTPAKGQTMPGCHLGLNLAFGETGWRMDFRRFFVPVAKSLMPQYATNHCQYQDDFHSLRHRHKDLETRLLLVEHGIYKGEYGMDMPLNQLHKKRSISADLLEPLPLRLWHADWTRHERRQIKLTAEPQRTGAGKFESNALLLRVKGLHIVPNNVTMLEKEYVTWTFGLCDDSLVVLQANQGIILRRGPEQNPRESWVSWDGKYLMHIPETGSEVMMTVTAADISHEMEMFAYARRIIIERMRASGE